MVSEVLIFFILHLKFPFSWGNESVKKKKKKKVKKKLRKIKNKIVKKIKITMLRKL